ncbi:L-histidine N(alpha)-methyltransferase [Pyruvatibacter sp.]|uniref:L-histidine N(alpha)-methyltransferase n=1 Tax=Pyruvatibacter sp. TaxID=1981328 RepID=UPI0032EB2A92
MTTSSLLTAKKATRHDGALAFFVDQKPALSTFRDDVLTGLSASPRAIAPKYFYDERGSELFDQICQTPEYYPTRTELGLLETYGADIARAVGPSSLVIEYGAGSSLKIRRLLEALDRPAGYVAVDISRDYLHGQMAALAADMPDISVGAICADFTKGFDLPPEIQPLGDRKLGFLPGSTIGNFTPAEARALLERSTRLLGKGGQFLIGVDLKKPKHILDSAYDDDGGVTAQFNLNLLTRMQTELGAELNAEGFDHVAFYNGEKGRVEMHLAARGPQTIRLEGHAFAFADGERIHTESSYKYDADAFIEMAQQAGFTARGLWTDDNSLFSLHLLEVAG